MEIGVQLLETAAATQIWRDRVEVEQTSQNESFEQGGGRAGQPNPASTFRRQHAPIFRFTGTEGRPR